MIFKLKRVGMETTPIMHPVDREEAPPTKEQD
jgi:hypothetical protein